MAEASNTTPKNTIHFLEGKGCRMMSNNKGNKIIAPGFALPSNNERITNAHSDEDLIPCLSFQ